jgi:hypothetical protein
VRFFTGLHHPADAQHFDTAFISVNAIRNRKGPFPANEWIMDSGAFTTIRTHGGYPHGPEEYAAQIKRWSTNGRLLAAVAQDWMCEADMLKRTGLTVPEHQRLTVERYDELDLAWDVAGVYILPVLQGYAPQDYVAHIRQYGARLMPGMWVGVGSVCKRNGDPKAIEDVLLAIKTERPDLRLHGFGLKKTAFKSKLVCSLLHTADSMAWSYSARKQGRDANSWREAKRWTHDVMNTFDPLHH